MKRIPWIAMWAGLFLAASHVPSFSADHAGKDGKQTASPPASLSPQQYKEAVGRTDYEKHTINVATFLKLMRRPDSIVLDLRDKADYNGSHIRGAKYLGPDVREDKVKRLVPSKDATVLLYCSNSLYMSRMISLTDVALPQLLAYGYKNVFLLQDATRGKMSDPGLLPMTDEKRPRTGIGRP